MKNLENRKMSNLTEVLSGLQEVTQRNLEILKAINDSFFSKREHVVAVIGDEKYVIPSYLYLESKIGDLENNFENLVNAPKTGTAAFVFDGNTQEIQMKSYTTTPDSVSLKSTENFMVEDNPIFKDFLSPNPYIRMDLSGVGADITEVSVRKIAVKNQELLSRISSSTIGDTSEIRWQDAAKALYGYESETDFVEYDTIRRLPIREGNAFGVYTIGKIDKEWIDTDLTEHYTLTLREKLNYWVDSGTIQKEITLGDCLVTENGTVKLKIVNLDYQKSMIECEVLNGAFADLVEYNSGNTNNDLATLRYFTTDGQDKDKYIDIPLEEDKNILVFVAPIDSRLNVQAPWGNGILVDTDKITIEEDGIVYTFTDYYKMRINNIGDTLYGLTKMFSTDLFNMSTEELSKLKDSRPEINTELLQVVEINSHLNDSESVKKIRSLHNQKSLYKTELDTVQHDIDDIVSLLSEMSFADTSENRVVYEEQLTNLNARKVELNKNISEIVDEINDNVNSADVPIENAKYHIRGFYDVSSIEEETGKKVVKIDVEYRYKNRNKSTGTALSMSAAGEDGESKTYIYSDWNRMYSYTLTKHPESTAQTITTDYPGQTQDKNIPSFNQIDIPITQGETVDIRLRVQFSDGWPFIETLSSWSPIVNIGFPDEFVANLPLVRIIETNNEDAEKYRFRNILGNEGVLEHVGDKIMDQDIKYLHQPESIASGFYTEERRVIPLADKLQSMDRDIRTILDEIGGVDPMNLVVTASDQNYTVNLIPYTETTFNVPAYSDTNNSRENVTENALDIVNITITNPTDRNMKLFSMFPGNTNSNVDYNTRSKFDAEDYSKKIEVQVEVEAEPEENPDPQLVTPDTDPEPEEPTTITVPTPVVLSVWGYSDNTDRFNTDGGDLPESNLFRQHQNQLVYFRLDSPYDNTMYYDSYLNYQGDEHNILEENNILCGDGNPQYIRKSDSSIGASLVMVVDSIDSITTVDGSRYKILGPGESLNIPLEFVYKTGTESTSYIEKTVSFDIWTSLFAEPANYTLRIRANYVDDISDRNRNQTGSGIYTPTIVR